MNAGHSDFVMTENAGGVSRRSFCSFVASGLVAACVTKTRCNRPCVARTTSAYKS